MGYVSASILVGQDSTVYVLKLVSQVSSGTSLSQTLERITNVILLLSITAFLGLIE